MAPKKVLGAHRAHITKVILPYSNRKDVEYDVPSEVRDSIQFVFVRTVEEALEADITEVGPLSTEETESHFNTAAAADQSIDKVEQVL